MGPRSWWLPTVTAALFASLFVWALLQHSTIFAVLDAVLFCVNAWVALRLRRKGVR